MEQPAKRAATHPFQPQPQHENPDIASLATLGMRIRKVVADGYSVSHEASYKHGLSTPQRSFTRVPLPGNIDTPPALTKEGSTFQSGSNVSEWGAPSMPVKTMPLQGNGFKRGLTRTSLANVAWTNLRWSSTTNHMVNYGSTRSSKSFEKLLLSSLSLLSLSFFCHFLLVNFFIYDYSRNTKLYWLDIENCRPFERRVIIVWFNLFLTLEQI